MLSIVPRSHSRATISEVSSVPVMVITMAITPGTMKSADRSSGLNQSRCSSDRPPPGRRPSSRPCPCSQTVSAPVT